MRSDPMARIAALEQKIAALEVLANGSGCAASESTVATETATRLRLELSILRRQAKLRGVSFHTSQPSSDGSEQRALSPEARLPQADFPDPQKIYSPRIRHSESSRSLGFLSQPPPRADSQPSDPRRSRKASIAVLRSILALTILVTLTAWRLGVHGFRGPDPLYTQTHRAVGVNVVPNQEFDVDPLSGVASTQPAQASTSPSTRALCVMLDAEELHCSARNAMDPCCKLAGDRPSRSRRAAGPQSSVDAHANDINEEIDEILHE